MSKTASDVLVDGLIAFGVDTVFGLPGDGINGIMEALRKRQNDIRFIQVRHEESAAFMACGYARWTGKLGVCIANSGPGGIHLLNGLYDAKRDGVPVLALTGRQDHDLVQSFTQQDVELDKLFADVCVYSARVIGGAQIESVIELACRTALTRRGVAHVAMPVDLQSQGADADHRSARSIPHHVSPDAAGSVVLPLDRQLAHAATILNAGKRVCILAGRGAVGAASELEAVAERLGAPVAKALLGKAALADTSPFCTGGIGVLGTRPSQEALETCDTLLIVGSGFPDLDYYPKPGNARAVQIDIDPQRIGLRYPAELGLIGDARRTLQLLLPRLAPQRNRSFLARAQKAMRGWRGLLHDQAEHHSRPMKPQVVAHELNKLLRNDAVIATDSGTNTFWCARYLDMRGDMKFSVSGNLATTACGLPYAMAAALAHPGRQVIAFVGDGGLTMLMGELANCVKYRLDVKVVVIKNNSFGQIKWEQIAFLGNPEYGCDLQPIDFAAVARACGVAGYTIDDPNTCAAILREALAAPGPAVIEAVVDPDEPPLPPSIAAEHDTSRKPGRMGHPAD